MRVLAFAMTEYQQLVLETICRQESMRFQKLFLRRGIKEMAGIAAVADEIIAVPDIPFSWRALGKYREAFLNTVHPHLPAHGPCTLYTHSVENPYTRLVTAALGRVRVELIEEGVGSYMAWGRKGDRRDLRARLSGLAISGGLKALGGHARIPRHLLSGGWSLFPHCFPGYPVNPRLLSRESFAETLEHSLDERARAERLPRHSMVFIQQPFVEMGILDTKSYVGIHARILGRLKRMAEEKEANLYWALHPRTDRKRETGRLRQMGFGDSKTVSVVDYRASIESLALANRGRDITYVSLASSALYTLFALLGEQGKLFRISDSILEQKHPIQKQVGNFLSSIGIPCLVM